MASCLQCNSSTKKYNKFCNKSCAAIYNNSHRSIESRNKQKESIRSLFGTVPRKCLVCSNELPPCHQKTCSKKCNLLHRWNEQKIKIENGLVKHSSSQRKYLSESKGYSCELCSVGDQWNGKPITLQVDHIDGNPDNNYPSNLRLLCPNCHSQTPTYKGGNKKNLKMDTRSKLHRKIYDGRHGRNRTFEHLL